MSSEDVQVPTISGWAVFYMSTTALLLPCQRHVYILVNSDVPGTYGHSQLKTGHPVRSTVGDHVGIPAAVCFVFLLLIRSSFLHWVKGLRMFC